MIVLTARGCCTDSQWDEVFQELEKEFARRNSLDENSRIRKETITKQYTPLHRDVYTLQQKFFTQEFLNLVEVCKNSSSFNSRLKSLVRDACPGKLLYYIPVFTAEFCGKLMEELINFEKAPCPKGRPNTMNNYGILINELGMDSFLNNLREEYLAPVCTVLFPDWCGTSGLDSHKAFTVTYKLGEDEDLNYHFDNAEVTLNFCLGQNFSGGQLYFGNMYDMPVDMSLCTTTPNRPLMGILHRGRQRHGALPITSGERYNLIIWMRSSSVRSAMCPMCKRKPVLVRADGFGDGFKQVAMAGSHNQN
uniref:Fe2OG dioxygenase domain-containing protein n=1 Tax=Strigamia maritima TaxID=126957 RepID=T1IJU6_STRMM